MTDREKLVELLGDNVCEHDECKNCEHFETVYPCINYIKQRMVDHLIANGVTFANRLEEKQATCNCKTSDWIPVTEGLPDEELEVYLIEKDWDVYPCLCAVKNQVTGEKYSTKLFYDGSNFVDFEYIRYTSLVTHWMPLPELPKED